MRRVQDRKCPALKNSFHILVSYLKYLRYLKIETI